MLWDRPSGSQLETNDSEETIAYLESLGWKKAGEKPKRTRRTKEQIAEDEANK